MSSDLRATIDLDEMKSILSAEFERNPALLDEVAKLLADDLRLGEPGALFNYLFIAAERMTAGTVHPVIGFRLRDPQERFAALAALDTKELIAAAGHGADLL